MLHAFYSMLTSKYIGPLREEAASWAEKLKEVEDVLEFKTYGST